MRTYLTLILGGALMLALAGGAYAADRKQQQKRDRIRQCSMTCQPAQQCLVGAVPGGLGRQAVALADRRRDRKQDGDRVRECSGDRQRRRDGSCILDGDGPPSVVCPNPDAPDDDGDGIPNGQDDDYMPPQDGSGRQRRGG